MTTSTTTRLHYDLMDFEDDYLDDDDYKNDFLDDEDHDFLLNHDLVENEMSDYDVDEEDAPSSLSSQQQSQQQKVVRASIAGVSVERDTGFWVVLQLPQNGLLAVQATNDPLDRVAATSGQALTLVQLLSNVDMAGAILPPHVLAQLVICALEEEASENDNNHNKVHQNLMQPWQQDLVRNVRDQIRKLYQGFSSYQKSDDDNDDDEDFTYTQSSAWIRSRVRLPLCTLDQVHLDLPSSFMSQLDLDVVVQDNNSGTTERWTLPRLQESTVAHVLHEEYHGTVSRHFAALALALRYKAPLVVTMPDHHHSVYDTDSVINNNGVVRFYESETALLAAFPLYTTVSNLQQSSNRVVQNIERGFEIHQLQAAMKVARQKQDYKAMAKIEAKMEELEARYNTSDDELPVQPETDTDAMQ